MTTAPFAFFDLRTRDIDGSRAFYTTLFGWAVSDLPLGDTSVPLLVGDNPGGDSLVSDSRVGDRAPWAGFTPLADGDSRPPGWIPYVPVDDLDAATTTALSLGARIAKDRVELPIGSLISLTDPNGATFVLWERRAQSDGPPAR